MKFRCSICLSPDYLAGGFSTTKCGHVYHSSCITSWLVDGRGKDCPNCRQPCNKRDVIAIYLTETSSELDTTVVDASTEEAKLNEFKNKYHHLKDQFDILSKSSAEGLAEAAENKTRLVEAEANVLHLTKELQKSKECQRLIAHDSREVRKERDKMKEETKKLRDENQQLQWLRVCTSGSAVEVDSVLETALSSSDSFSIRQNLAACIGALKSQLDKEEKARKKLQAECDGWSSKELQLTLELDQRRKAVELLKTQVHDLEEERHRNVCKISSLSKMLNQQAGLPQTQIKRFIAESPAPQEWLRSPEDSPIDPQTPPAETDGLPRVKKQRTFPQLETLAAHADYSLALGKKAGARRDVAHAKPFPKSKSANPFKKSIFGAATPVDSSQTGDDENATPWLVRANQVRRVIKKKNEFALKFDQDQEEIVIDDLD
ncbi:hypothetical protein RvY_09494 [Ramazzottius varieornatus]|uniref:RING-type domain-containing protein n=1 Tax=Ramazzottius varieornatus TaxID=947166 RepID=A0A1D1VHF5_RAMVA|nr:hypothetical protein RvY_09494 [Ramazzottius varieornatus]